MNYGVSNQLPATSDHIKSKQDSFPLRSGVGQYKADSLIITELLEILHKGFQTKNK